MTEQHHQAIHEGNKSPKSIGRLPSVEHHELMEKVGHLLNDIAVTASTIEQLSVEILSAGSDASRASAMVDAVRHLAQRIGWTADLAIERGGVGPMVRGGAVEWMAPDLYLLNKAA
jgi:hypothetical protein